jgi:hypothetical protein
METIKTIASDKLQQARACPLSRFASLSEWLAQNMGLLVPKGGLDSPKPGPESGGVKAGV